MAEKSSLAPTAETLHKLEAVREIIVGLLTREFDQKIVKLSRQVEQLREQHKAQRAAYEKKLTQMQTEYFSHLKRYTHSAASLSSPQKDQRNDRPSLNGEIHRSICTGESCRPQESGRK